MQARWVILALGLFLIEPGCGFDQSKLQRASVTADSGMATGAGGTTGSADDTGIEDETGTGVAIGSTDATAADEATDNRKVPDTRDTPSSEAVSDTGDTPGSGGATGTGGVPGTGGIIGTGGVPGTGGVIGTGGVPGYGGTTSTPPAKLTGTTFGTGPPQNGNGFNFAKAFDGNIKTYFDDSNSEAGYTGIELGTLANVSQIRFYPRVNPDGTNGAPRMVGGKFQCGSTSQTDGFVDLYTIPSTPRIAWADVPISNSPACLYLRYLGPKWGWTNVAEIEFWGVPAN